MLLWNISCRIHYCKLIINYFYCRMTARIGRACAVGSCGVYAPTWTTTATTAPSVGKQLRITEDHSWVARWRSTRRPPGTGCVCIAPSTPTPWGATAPEREARRIRSIPWTATKRERTASTPLVIAPSLGGHVTYHGRLLLPRSGGAT